MSKKVTMQDIADKLGITKVSVSKALNNQQGISDGLREQIIKVAKQIGYTKVKHADEKKPYNFAWVTQKRFFLEDETFYTTIYYYINRKCIDNNYSVSCFVINDQEELTQHIPSRLISESFDGIFVAGEFKNEYLMKLDGINCPKVAIDFSCKQFDVDSIIVDNYSTGFEVTQYLIDKGHKNIGFVGNISQDSNVCNRYFGYYKALKLNNLPIRDDWHISNDNNMISNYSLEFELPNELPTAFVCYCDKAAFTLIQKLESSGVKVPNDVSIISFDNTSICSLITPKITSVDIDRKQIASYSMEQMISRIENPQLLARKVCISTIIVERESVKSI